MSLPASMPAQRPFCDRWPLEPPARITTVEPLRTCTANWAQQCNAAVSEEGER